MVSGVRNRVEKIQWAWCFLKGLRRDMGIARSGVEAPMTQQDLNGSAVGAGLEKMSGKAVAKGVDGDPLGSCAFRAARRQTRWMVRGQGVFSDFSEAKSRASRDQHPAPRGDLPPQRPHAPEPNVPRCSPGTAKRFSSIHVRRREEAPWLIAWVSRVPSCCSHWLPAVAMAVRINPTNFRWNS